MKCTNCGTEVELGAMFCDNCGSKLPSETQPAAHNNYDGSDDEYMFCGNCGTKVSINDTFCGNCGTITSHAAKAGSDTDFNHIKHEEKHYPSAKKSSKSRTIALVSVIVALILGVGGTATWFCYENYWKDIDDDKEAVDIAKDETAAEEVNTKEPETPPVKNDLIDINKIDEIIAADANNAQISVCVKDLNNDVIYSTRNASTPMSASALVNIPILYVTAQKLEDASITWDTEIGFSYRFNGRGNIKQNQDGTLIPVRTLVEEMLYYSDNNATNSLIDFYGNNTISLICDNNGYSSIDIQRYIGQTNTTKDNFISANDVTGIMAELYETNLVGIGRDYLTHYFKILDSAANNGIGRALPSSVVFLNHNAVTSSIYNEVGIVEDANVRYVITVLANNGQQDSSAETASKISEYVYAALNQ